MALSADSVRRTQVFDTQAHKPKPARGGDGSLPMAYFGQAVGALEHEEDGPPPELYSYPTAAKYAEFRKAIGTLSDPRVQRLMDSVEAIGNPNVNPNNGRFGTLGLSILTQLDENSPQWGEVTSPEEKQQIIQAARTAYLYNAPGGFLWQVHGGDQGFEPGEMSGWYEKSPDLDGVVGPFQQNPDSVSSPFNAALLAVANSKYAGLLKDMIRIDANGDYHVTFPGNPLRGSIHDTRTVIVGKDEIAIANPLTSSGDLDVRILEEAARRYYKAALPDGQNHDSWHDEASNFELLTGASPVLAGAWPGTGNQRVVTREVLQEFAARYEAGQTSMTFAYRQPDGRHHAFAIDHIDFSTDTVYFKNPYNSEVVEKMSITELLAKAQLRVAAA